MEEAKQARPSERHHLTTHEAGHVVLGASVGDTLNAVVANKNGVTNASPEPPLVDSPPGTTIGRIA